MSESLGLGGSFAQWGAVPVTPRNFFRLLERNEAVLLFPGGAREACHGPGEKYQLFWPEKTDFVRAAAKFNAIVVPFGGVGSADNVRFLNSSSSESQSRAPLNLAVEGGGFMPVSEALKTPPSFPSVFPRFPPATQAAAGFGDRFYYSFGAPVDLQHVNPKDKDACDEAYSRIRHSVEGEIQWLLETRVKDPNRNFLRRLLWERLASLDPPPKRVKEGSLKGAVIRSYGPRAPSFPL